MRFEDHPHRSRLLWVYGCVVISVTTLILRLAYVDIALGKRLHESAGRTLTTRLGVLPNRGWIFDHHMRVLAYNAPSVSVVLNRFDASRKDYPTLAKRLAPVLHEDEKKLLTRMKQNPGDKEVSLFEGANDAQIAYIAEHQSLLPGVQYVEDVRRVYPFSSLAGHILGYIQPQPASEAQAYRDKDYLPEQKVGITGVERQYESILAGHHGNRVWKINAAGVPLDKEAQSPAPTPGNSIRLTIDASLQAVAQQLVQDAMRQPVVKRPYEKSHGKPTDAEAVMLDTRTGGVLSMVSFPYYDPNWFVDAGAYEQHRTYIENARLTPILNHTLTSPRYPGSTVKPVNLLAAMASGAISPNTRILDRGKLMVGTYEAHDWQPYGHGVVDVPSAIQQSCDTYMYQTGMWMANWYGNVPRGESLSLWNQRDRIRGLNQMLDWEWHFGLGPTTGIDLPGEASGRFYANDSIHHRIVPYDLQASEREMTAHHRVANAGLLYDNAFASIGQMQEFTPLQLAVYAMTLANNGLRLQPHVLDAVLSEDGKRVVRTFSPHVVDHVAIPPSHLKAVKEGMYRVVNRKGGTAFGAFRGATYRAAGKTGTAEVSQWGENTDISLFIGYAPADHPEVAISVMVPGGGESSDVAVPLARKLLDAYFEKTRDSKGNSFTPADWSRTNAWKTTNRGQFP